MAKAERQSFNEMVVELCRVKFNSEESDRLEPPKKAKFVSDGFDRGQNQTHVRMPSAATARGWRVSLAARNEKASLVRVSGRGFKECA